MQINIWIKILFFCVSIFIGNQKANAEKYAIVQIENTTCTGKTEYLPYNNDKYKLFDYTHKQKERETACITENTQTIHLYASRIPRILPSYGTYRNYFSIKKHILYTHKNKYHTYLNLYLRRFTTPVPSSIPYDFYVIALRHIIR